MALAAGKIESEQVEIIPFKLEPYGRVLSLQRRLQQELIAGSRREVLILCQHPPVITLGKGARRENVLTDSAKLAELGIEVVATGRGGDVTYHGPGQLVGYPILDLRRRKIDIGHYMRSLEEIMLRTTADFGVSAERRAGFPGLYTSCTNAQLQKIGFVGVRLSRWCSMHGFALNVSNCLDGFQLIIPCGLKDIAVTSMEQKAGRAFSVSQVQRVLSGHFRDVFD